MHCCNWQLLFALLLLLLTILYASLQLTMFVFIIFRSHFLNVPLEMTFLVCTTFEWLTTKCFYWLFWMVFCVHSCTNLLIHYCKGNPLYIDNFYTAKLSPSPNPSSIGAEVVIFSFNLTTYLTNHHPSTQKSFLQHNWAIQVVTLYQ